MYKYKLKDYVYIIVFFFFASHSALNTALEILTKGMGKSLKRPLYNVRDLDREKGKLLKSEWRRKLLYDICRICYIATSMVSCFTFEAYLNSVFFCSFNMHWNWEGRV